MSIIIKSPSEIEKMRIAENWLPKFWK